MSIDWFTVAAQVLNFVILVLLLKRFLYKPILKTIDERENRIASDIADAREKGAEAEKERRAFSEKNEEFDRQRNELMRRVSEEADAKRQRLLEEARKEADDLSAKRRDMLQKDFHKLRESVRLRTQQEVFAIARKALRDLGAADLETHIAGVFVRRLRALGGAAKQVLADAMETSGEPIVLRSAFELPEEQRTAIQNAVRDTFPTDLNIRFQTEPKLIGGIELAVNGQKIAWSISDYLDSMEEDIARLILEKDGAKTGAAMEAEAAGAGKGAD